MTYSNFFSYFRPITCSNSISSFFNLNNPKNINFVNMFNGYTTSNLPKNCEYETDQKILKGNFNLNYFPCPFPDTYNRYCWNPLAIKLLSAKDYLESSFKNNLIPSKDYLEASYRSILKDSFLDKLYGPEEILCLKEGENLVKCVLSKDLNKKIDSIPSKNQLKYSLEKIDGRFVEALEYPNSLIQEEYRNDSVLLKCYQQSLDEQSCKKIQPLQPGIPVNLTNIQNVASQTIPKAKYKINSTFLTLTAITATSGALFFGYKTAMEVDQLLNPLRFQYRNKDKASVMHAAVYSAATLACSYFAISSLANR